MIKRWQTTKWRNMKAGTAIYSDFLPSNDSKSEPKEEEDDSDNDGFGNDSYFFGDEFRADPSYDPAPSLEMTRWRKSSRRGRSSIAAHRQEQRQASINFILHAAATGSADIGEGGDVTGSNCKIGRNSQDEIVEKAAMELASDIVDGYWGSSINRDHMQQILDDDDVEDDDDAEDADDRAHLLQ